jgi:uncharacterized protein YfaS (alpha-2-macroglobulin family)
MKLFSRPFGSLRLVLSVLLVFAFSCKAGEEPALQAVFSGAYVSPGRPVEDFADYRIAYYQAVLSEGEAAGTVAESDEAFTITDYGPSGELPSEIKKPAIYAVFSQPVVPLARLGEPLTEAAGFFTIEPPLAGIYRWYGSRLLSFQPDAENMPQHEYTVTVSDKIRSLGGKSLEGIKSFSFETERLEILDWQLGAGGSYWISTRNADPADAKYISIYFSHAVNLDEIAKWLEIRAGGRIYPFTLDRLPKTDEGYYSKRYSPQQGVLLVIKDPLPLDTDVQLALLAGARSEPGWIGTKEEKIFSFHTLIPFSFNDVSVRSRSNPRTEEGDTIPIALEFSQKVDPANPASYFSISGIPPLKQENVHIYGNTVVLNRLPLEYEKSYKVTISGKLQDLWGRQLGQDLTVSASVGEANSYVYFLNRGSRMLEAGFPAKIVWETQNPVSILSGIAAARGPYEQLPSSKLKEMDLSKLPKNSKRFMMEDLSPYLGPSGRGSAAMRWEYQTRNSWQPGRIDKNNSWLTVQVTDIGLTVRYAYNMVLVWAASLSTGEPLRGAKAALLEGGREIKEVTTDAQGLGVFEFKDGEFASLFTRPDLSVKSGEGGGNSVGRGLRIRVSEGGGAAAGGDEVEFIPNESHNLWRFDIEALQDPFTVEKARPLIFLFTDRGLYKPGETVTFRGIDRNLVRGKFEAYTGGYTLTASAGFYDGPELASLKGSTTLSGGSYGSFTLPENIDPGQYTLRYTRTGNDSDVSKTISFTVANFQRLRFESSLSFPDIQLFQGDRITGRLDASYLAGGALSGAPYSYYWTREASYFSPGNSDGDWKNWRSGPYSYEGRNYISRGEGTLGPDGSADLSQTAGADGAEGAPYNYRLEVSVQDAARQEISARASVLVHPASFYIASRLDARQLKEIDSRAATPQDWFLEAGAPASLSWALVNPEGKPWESAGGQEITAQLIRHEWKQSRQQGIAGRINLNWEKSEVIEKEELIKLEKGKYSGLINFTPGKSGEWEVRLRALDPKGRSALTRYNFYVSGAGWALWGSSDNDAISILPDKTMYAPGDTAKLLVQSPLPKGRYLLTLEREGIVSQKIIELDGSARTIEIPVEESFVPIMYVSIASYTVRKGPPENSYYEPDLDKPKGLFGMASLYVDNESRHYKIEIENSKGVYAPAEEADVTLKVTLNGKPAPGVELTFMAVDRGVVDLIDYHVPDPLAYYYNPANFPLGVRGADSRSLLIDPVTYALTDLQGGDDEDSSKLDERKDFRPTAVFEPYLVSGADGTVRVQFGLPDNLTTYRCTAVAAGIDDFGIAENDLRVSAPLTATAALPRKLRWRDTGTVSLILTNLKNEEVDAEVSLAIEKDSSGGESLWSTVLELDGESKAKVKIPPGGTVELPFRVAAVGSGNAKLVFTLRSPEVNERIIKNLPVDRPVLYETVTVMGNLGPDSKGGASFIEEGVVLPSLVPEGTGSLSVSLSASRLAMLKEAVRYLLDYPYGCLEQRSARLLPLVAFGDHLEAFSLETPVKDIPLVIKNELDEISKSQLADGGFPYWPGGKYSSSYVTLRVAHIAALAKAKGYDLPERFDSKKLLAYLGYLENQLWFTADPFLKGYSLWVRAMYGERAGAEISAFLKRGDELGISGWSFAGLAAHELGMKDLAFSTRDRVKRFIRPGTRSLDLGDSYEQKGNYWGSDIDRYALALMLYQSLSPGDDMTTRLASTLIERQRRGVWTNTASSFWAVLAFGRVADAEKEEGVDFAARVSLGGVSLKDVPFKSYGLLPEAETWLLSGSPVGDLEQDVLLPLRIEREGPAGRLYYTASLRYGIPTELAGARDEGISVFAETYDSDGSRINDGRLVPGKTYTRKLVISTSRDRTFMAVRAPVPSGAEIVDAVFVTSSTDRGEQKNNNYENNYEEAPVKFVMDDEVRFHWDLFPGGKKEVEFRFRAVMPGVYPTPPVQAECMYESEIFGRSAGELIRVVR